MLEQVPKSQWFRVQTRFSYVILCNSYLQTVPKGAMKRNHISGLWDFHTAICCQAALPRCEFPVLKYGSECYVWWAFMKNKQAMLENTAHLYIFCWRRELPNSWEGKWFHGLFVVSPLNNKIREGEKTA